MSQRARPIGSDHTGTFPRGYVNHQTNVANAQLLERVAREVGGDVAVERAGRVYAWTAADERTLRGIPAIAISLERHSPPDFRHAARFARALAEETIARGAEAIPAAALLNVNLPHVPIEGYQVTFLGRRVYRDQVEVRHDLRGRSYYWIGGPEENATDLPGSDCSAVQSGRASVTPLGLDLTHHGLLHQLDAWQVGSFVRAAAERAR